jgi:hypothetical protein
MVTLAGTIDQYATETGGFAGFDSVRGRFRPNNIVDNRLPESRFKP